MVNNKKKYTVILLLIFSIFGSVFSTDYSYTPKKNEFYPRPLISSPSVRNNLIFGMMYGPDNLDIHELWESAGYDIVSQIYEGLYRYDIASPGLELIPQLALGFGVWDLATVNPADNIANYTIALREDVWFHDGTKFNAAAVKWSFDRLAYFMGLGPAILTDTAAQIESLYRWPDWTPVINHTEVVDEYTIKFVLNKPYGVFDAILTFNAAWIMSPAASMAETRIQVSQAVGPNGTGHRISGTGPFIFESYTAGVETRMVRNDDYWGGAGEIENLVFSVIQDTNARNSALLNGDIDILDAPHVSYYDTMAADPDINLYEAGSGTITQYLGFNNKILNKTWRNAMSYAINYTYMIDELLEGEAVRLKSPLPIGIQFANWSYDVPTYNLTKARQYMQSMGFGVGFTTDGEWQAATFRSVNFTYNLGNKFREDMLILLQQNLDLIGIDVLDNGLAFTPYLDLVYNRISPGYDGLELWFIGWWPDYNDPSNYVNSLMSNVSFGNAAQINDPTLEAYMLDGLQETDQDVRRQIYWDIQKYIVEDLRPWAFGYVGKNYDAWDADLKGYPSNSLGYNYFYPCYWESYSIQITHPPDVSYIEGSTGNSISWVMTAINTSNPTYTIHRDLTLLRNDTWTPGMSEFINVDGLSTGVYNYTIQAFNGPFPQLNNLDYVIVNVTSEVNEGTPDILDIPGFSVGILLIGSSLSVFYVRRRSKNKISKIKS